MDPKVKGASSTFDRGPAFCNGIKSARPCLWWTWSKALSFRFPMHQLSHSIHEIAYLQRRYPSLYRVSKRKWLLGLALLDILTFPHRCPIYPPIAKPILNVL